MPKSDKQGELKKEGSAAMVLGYAHQWLTTVRKKRKKVPKVQLDELHLNRKTVNRMKMFGELCHTGAAHL